MSLGYHSHGVYRKTPFLIDFDPYEGWEEAGSTVVLRPVTVAGVAGAFSRASTATCTDKNGRVMLVPAGFPCFEHEYIGSVWTPVGVRVQRAGINACLHSEDLTQWTDHNTPVITSAINRIGCVSIDRITADVNDGKKRTVTLTGDGVKSFSVFITHPGAATVRVTLVDTSAAAARLSFTAQWTSATDPTALTVAMATGTNLNDTLSPKAVRKTDKYGQAGWLIEMQTTAVTAANTHELTAFILTGTAVDIGGFQVEDNAIPSTYMKSGASAGTRVVDSLSLPANFLPRDLSVLAKMYEYGTFQATGNRCLQLGATLGNTASSARIHCAAVGDVRLTYDNGSVDEDADATTGAVVRRDLHDVRANILAAGIKVARRINGGTETTPSAAAAQTHPAAYGAATLLLTPGSPFLGNHTISRIRVGVGDQTLAQLEAGL